MDTAAALDKGYPSGSQEVLLVKSSGDLWDSLWGAVELLRRSEKQVRQKVLAGEGSAPVLSPHWWVWHQTLKERLDFMNLVASTHYFVFIQIWFFQESCFGKLWAKALRGKRICFFCAQNLTQCSPALSGPLWDFLSKTLKRIAHGTRVTKWANILFTIKINDALKGAPAER